MCNRIESSTSVAITVLPSRNKNFSHVNESMTFSIQRPARSARFKSQNEPMEIRCQSQANEGWPSHRIGNKAFQHLPFPSCHTC
ncbi:MAG: hypothetical protein CMJ39_06825 [Phycisphaerae bacterium]|nr:hypothetical protein [Phycisphaerae bacterium]